MMKNLPTSADGFGEHDTAGVDRLEDALLVDSSGDLADEHRSHPLVPQLLVHAQEVDLHHWLGSTMRKSFVLVNYYRPESNAIFNIVFASLFYIIVSKPISCLSDKTRR